MPDKTDKPADDAAESSASVASATTQNPAAALPPQDTVRIRRPLARPRQGGMWTTTEPEFEEFDWPADAPLPPGAEPVAKEKK